MSKIIANFALAYRLPKSDMGLWAGCKDILFNSVYQAQSWLFGISQILSHSPGCSNDRCLSGMIITVSSVMRWLYHIIQREASALLFLLRWAMREPLQVERATDSGFHAIFLTNLSNPESL